MNRFACIAASMMVGGAFFASADEKHSPTDSEQIMVVLDASGSMWGQIEGRTKFEIVREAYGELVSGWEAGGTQSGLVVYGHRRKGDCTDIELVALPGQSDAQSLGRTVYRLDPKGKTPLGDAVRLAAEELRFTEQSATVILLSDGVETCGVNSCQLGQDLEALGVDFTAHVIGFGLQSPEEVSQLRCLADTTGGNFYLADDAVELGNAFNDVADLQALSFQALLSDTGESASAVTWRLVDQDGEVLGTASSELGTIEITALVPAGIDDGSFIIRATTEGYGGEVEFTLPMAGPETIYVRLRATDNRVSFDVPDTIFAGTAIKIGWTAQIGTDDWIMVVPRGGNWDEAFDLASVAEGNPLELDLPGEAGEYDLIYTNNDGERHRVDGRLAISTIAPDYRLAPAGVIRAGETFLVEWSGPGAAGDMIAIGPRTSGTGDYSSIQWIDGHSPVQLRAPTEPGEYELRYFGDGYELQFVQPVMVE